MSMMMKMAPFRRAVTLCFCFLTMLSIARGDTLVAPTENEMSTVLKLNQDACNALNGTEFVELFFPGPISYWDPVGSGNIITSKEDLAMFTHAFFQSLQVFDFSYTDASYAYSSDNTTGMGVAAASFQASWTCANSTGKGVIKEGIQWWNFTRSDVDSKVYASGVNMYYDFVGDDCNGNNNGTATAFPAPWVERLGSMANATVSCNSSQLADNFATDGSIQIPLGSPLITGRADITTAYTPILAGMSQVQFHPLVLQASTDPAGFPYAASRWKASGPGPNNTSINIPVGYDFYVFDGASMSGDGTAPLLTFLGTLAPAQVTEGKPQQQQQQQQQQQKHRIHVV